MSSNKWKDRLFSSSLPLEFEVAKFLARREYAVEFNYSYQRMDGMEQKEFSVDINANHYYPFKWEADIKIKIDLLVECKYRNPNVSWLFVPEINCDHHSESYFRNAIKFDDAFSGYFHSDGPFGLPDCESCLKGVEIKMSTGDVHDSDIIHGVNQLSFAIPYFLERHVSGNLNSDPSDAHPYIICPILVTTAKLLLLNDDFSLPTLRETDELEKLAKEVPFLKLHSSLPPSFHRHCSNIFKGIPSPQQVTAFDRFSALRKVRLSPGKMMPKHLYSQPEFRLWDYKNGSEDIYSTMLICNLSHFPKLVEEIEDAIAFVGKGLRKIKQRKK